ncbi:hypothetical protein EST38_g4260 [Candolleomyces aberdarensis]|uniref:Uncharacterized protein n=1 Tax=Candolleomyces aberdarensis TaxID=2316362 RepID=A0A4Q2DQ82_9AGAR|nr:hypothetical protein EST38_g4260 [Candolleomyces aberdarensis]
MPEQPSSQENYSCPFQKARKTLAAPTFAIYIDQSYAVYNNYHNSQNQTTTEFVNSNNFSSTKARNSSLNGDTRSTFPNVTPRHLYRISPKHPQLGTKIRGILSMPQLFPTRVVLNNGGTMSSPIPHHPLVRLDSLRGDLRAPTQARSDMALHNHAVRLPHLLTSDATLSVAPILPVAVSRNMRHPPAAFWPTCHFLFDGL